MQGEWEWASLDGSWPAWQYSAGRWRKTQIWSKETWEWYAEGKRVKETVRSLEENWKANRVRESEGNDWRN